MEVSLTNEQNFGKIGLTEFRNDVLFFSALFSCTLNKATFVTGLDGYLSSVDLRSLILDKFKIYLKHVGSLFQSKFVVFKSK